MYSTTNLILFLGPCDVADFCNGVAKWCVDKVANSSVVCQQKSSAGFLLFQTRHFVSFHLNVVFIIYKACDVDDYCDGYNKTCTGKVAVNGTLCRDASGTFYLSFSCYCW